MGPRYHGQSHESPWRRARELRQRFEALHEERYGHRDPDGDVELVTVRVTGRLPAPPVDFGAPAGERSSPPSSLPEATLVVPEGVGSTDDAGRSCWSGRERRPDRSAGHGGPARRVRDGAARALGPQREHQERRDCSTARSSTRPARWSCRPSTSGAPRRDARRGRCRTRPRPPEASPGSSTTLLGGTHLPSRSSRPPSTAASCSASRRRARTTPTSAGACQARAVGLDDAQEEGVVIAARARRRAIADSRRCASPRTAPTCARPPTARAPALGELADRVGSTSCARRRARSSLRRAAHARLPGRARDGTRTAVDLLEAAEGDLELRVAATVDGDERRSTRGSAAQHLATSTARWPSRRARACSPCACSPTPTSARCGAYRPITVVAPEGCSQRPVAGAVAGSNVETRRAWPTSCSPRSAARSARAR